MHVWDEGQEALLLPPDDQVPPRVRSPRKTTVGGKGKGPTSRRCGLRPGSLLRPPGWPPPRLNKPLGGKTNFGGQPGGRRSTRLQAVAGRGGAGLRGAWRGGRPPSIRTESGLIALQPRQTPPAGPNTSPQRAPELSETHFGSPLEACAFPSYISSELLWAKVARAAVRARGAHR